MDSPISKKEYTLTGVDVQRSVREQNSKEVKLCMCIFSLRIKCTN